MITMSPGSGSGTSTLSTSVSKAMRMIVVRRQRTQLINALRGHLAEFGLIFPQGPAHLKQATALLEDGTTEVPDTAREIAQLCLDLTLPPRSNPD